MQHCAYSVLTSAQAQENEHKHLRHTLKSCGYPNSTSVKTAASSRKNTNNADREKKNKLKNVVIPVSEKLRRIFNKHHIPMFFECSNTLRQLVHPKDRTRKNKKSNLVYAVQCSAECTDIYIYIYILVKPPSKERNTGGPNCQVKTQQFMYPKDKGKVI